MAAPSRTQRGEPAVLAGRREDLTLWVIERVAKTPREHKFTLGDQLVETCLEVTTLLVGAFYAREKLALLATATATATATASATATATASATMRALRRSQTALRHACIAAPQLGQVAPSEGRGKPGVRSPSRRSRVGYRGAEPSYQATLRV